MEQHLTKKEAEYLTIKEAAQEFHISESLIFKHLKKGTLKRYYAELPKRLLVKRSDLQVLRQPKEE